MAFFIQSNKSAMIKIKSIILLLTCIFLQTQCKNSDKAVQDGESSAEQITEHYGDGNTSRTYTRINGEIEGIMTDYYPDGKLKAERFFMAGVQVGKTTLYFPSGAIKEVQYYENGMKNGGDTVFYENGQPEFALEYKDEKRNGYLRKWAPDGLLIYEARFEMDSLVEVKGEKLK
jgi:antitoxin component YwqK of YwqJK toxin-antitoxin module